MRSLLLWLVLAGALHGCTTAPGAPPARAGSEAAAATAASLSIERQWLASWFKGTPVVIAQQGDAVTVDVPREFCFDRSKSAVKPALAAVLDKVAESMRRVPTTQLAFVAAPEDGNAGAPIALQRAGQVRDYLRGRGVAPDRLGRASVTTTAAVQLRLDGPAAP